MTTDGKGLQHDGEPDFSVFFVHFDDPSAGLEITARMVGNITRVELKVGEFVVELGNHVVFQILTWVGIWVDAKKPSYSGDFGRAEGIVAEPDVCSTKMGDDNDTML